MQCSLSAALTKSHAPQTKCSLCLTFSLSLKPCLPRAMFNAPALLNGGTLFNRGCMLFSIQLGRLVPFLNCDQLVAKIAFIPFARGVECWKVPYSHKKPCLAVGRLTEQETNGDLTRKLIHNSRRDPTTPFLP